MSPDERHEDVVRRYPGGLTPAQFRHEVLASADEDGKLDPPALADWFSAQSLLMGMYMQGLIVRSGPEKRLYDRSGPWILTDAGRAAARALALIAKGWTAYAAAKHEGIALSTIYRALKRMKAGQ